MHNTDIKHCIATAPDGVRIAYQVSGQGPALVFCHAMANDHRMYDQHRDLFSESHTLITFDQRGSGYSDHPPFEEGPTSLYTVDKFGDDLKAVLDHLGINRATILGFSMGAVAALSFSTRWLDRVERLVLASAMASRLPHSLLLIARAWSNKCWMIRVWKKPMISTSRERYLMDFWKRINFMNSLHSSEKKQRPKALKVAFVSRLTVHRWSMN